ncbi:MAG: Low-molecular weight cobalt-containing nitrile hydratase subunit alpha [Alphaproteobacteria bacterium MarineAlpha2_Bin1]|nr:MAG: Low-molecular weight cobalt-containing nitrile hydratase subunit alpha [Alphaproteobacteria bacterium MarineAlpha2_Bin1]
MPHDHEKTYDEIRLPDEMELLERAIRELLIEKGIFSADDFSRQMQESEKISPADGAKIVARAWVDKNFKINLIQNPKSALASIGYKVGAPEPNLAVVEQTKKIHYIVVCTLCSCYPRSLLGPPPEWYKSLEYRSRVVINPREVLEEFGTKVDNNVEIKVLDSTADLRYFVLPQRPEGTENYNEAELAALVSRDSMVGVTVPQKP